MLWESHSDFQGPESKAKGPSASTDSLALPSASSLSFVTKMTLVSKSSGTTGSSFMKPGFSKTVVSFDSNANAVWPKYVIFSNEPRPLSR